LDCFISARASNVSLSNLQALSKAVVFGFGLLVLGLVCLSFPVKFTLGMGQINNFILLIFVVAIYFLQQKKSSLASFLFALSFAIKLFPAYLILQFIVMKKWKFLFTFLISSIALSGFCLSTGWSENKPLFLSAFLTDASDRLENRLLQSSINRIHRQKFSLQFFQSNVGWFTFTIFYLLSCLVVFKARKNKTLINMSFGLLITLNLIVNNFSWQHHFVFLIFPFLATLFYIQKLKNKRKWLLALFVSYALVSINLVNPHAVPILLQSHVLYGTIVLWVLAAQFIYFAWRET